MIGSNTRLGGLLALALALLGGVCTLTGCSGGIRSTTTARASEETLLVSTSAELAIREYPTEHLKGKDVFLDVRGFDAIDKNYVVSSLREYLTRGGAMLVEEEAAALVVEVRNGTLGVNDPAWLIGVPALPIGYSDVYARLPQVSIGYDPQCAWAKFQLWTYDAKLGDTIHLGEVWGHADTGWFQNITPNAITTINDTIKPVRSQ